MEKYKDIGLKLTPQRLAILKYLEGNKTHPSADEIYRAVSKSFPTMSFATVYNTLEALRRRGNVLELTTDPQKKRFETNTEPHHHLVCVRCRRIMDIDVSYDLTLPEAARQGYEIISNQIEFYGICPRCRHIVTERYRGHTEGGVTMAVFKCEKCGATKDGRCKPQKCPVCGQKGCMQKA